MSQLVYSIYSLDHGEPLSSPTSARAFPTLPLCAGLYSDAQGQAMLPFACAVNADSYRHTLLEQAHKDKEAGKTSDAGSFIQHPSSSGSSAAPLSGRTYASEPHSPLRASDLALIGDALLCNTTLTALSLERACLDSHALPPLCSMLQQHASLTSISLAGNLLGLHPDAEQLRQLFHVLASRATLPHLSTLNLSHKSVEIDTQFPPRSLEVFCSSFVRVAPSIQCIDWRENEVGLRGGWAVVDALRLRNEARRRSFELNDPAEFPPLTLITTFHLECDEPEEHATASLVSRGVLPQPNLAQVRSSTRVRPAYWVRVQQLLKDNREEADLQIVREARAQKEAQEGAGEKKEEEKEAEKGKGAKGEKKVPESKQKEPAKSAANARLQPASPSLKVGAGRSSDVSSFASAAPSSAPSSAASAAASSSSSASSSVSSLPSSVSLTAPTFLSPAAFHASLGRMVSELNAERATLFQRSRELNLALQRVHELEATVDSQAKALRDVQERWETQGKELARETATRKELEAAVLAAKTREAALVASHTRQMTAMHKRAEDDTAEQGRLRSIITRLQAEKEEARMQHAREMRAAAELAASRDTSQSTHASNLRELERRLEQLQWDRKHHVDGMPPSRALGAEASAAIARARTGAILSSSAASGSSGPVAHQLPVHFSSAVNQTAIPTSPVVNAKRLGGGNAIAATTAGTSAQPILQLRPTPLGASPTAPLSSSAPFAPSASSGFSHPSSALSPSSTSPHSATRSALAIQVTSPTGAAVPLSPSPTGPDVAGGRSTPGSGSASPSPSPSPLPSSPAVSSPSVLMFSSGGPPLPARVLSPTHPMQLMPHHIPTWQQPPQKQMPLKLKPKQRDT